MVENAVALRADLSNKYRSKGDRREASFCQGFCLQQPRRGTPAKAENPAREEVRRVSETDWQPGGGGVTSPTKNAGRRSASFDALTIHQARSKNSRYFAPQHCACRMAENRVFRSAMAIRPISLTALGSSNGLQARWAKPIH